MRGGFTLIELMIGIAIIGFIASMIAPLLGPAQAGETRKKFISDLNSLVQLGWQQAVVSGKVHRVFFNIKERIAFVEKELNANDATKPTFAPLKQMVTASRFSWPDSLDIKQFIIEGSDEMKRFSSGAKEVWFYIIPDGLTQQVTINLLDKEKNIDNKPVRVGLVLQPFIAQFKVYDVFQK